MGKVIDIRSGGEYDPDHVFAWERPAAGYLSGECVCLRCRARWVECAPVGTVCMECPMCQTMWGIFNAPALAKDGDTVWRCNCGSEVFQLMVSGPRCVTCGVMQDGGDHGGPNDYAA